MAKHSAARKTAHLGIPLGTAANRLRKLILFRYVQLAGDDVCFKCGGRIETVDDLSIEHKLPWEGRSNDLYWDLDNIAFSHLKCNRPHTYVSAAERPAARRIGPLGTAWCWGHRDFLPVANFGRNARRWNGLDNECRECRSKRRSG